MGLQGNESPRARRPSALAMVCHNSVAGQISVYEPEMSLPLVEAVFFLTWSRVIESRNTVAEMYALRVQE